MMLPVVIEFDGMVAMDAAVEGAFSSSAKRASVSILLVYRKIGMRYCEKIYK